MRQIDSDPTADFSQNSFQHNSLPSILAFPKDGNSWRIDWFGDVAFPNRTLRRTQPSVLVHLSRVLDMSFRENPNVLLSPDSTFVAKQRKVWVSVGTLPLLAVGDVWRDGQLEMRPDYELEHFDDLDINSETSVLIKAGLNLEDKGFLLPRAEHPWHMQCTQSYCLMVELQHNRRLIIPCVELIRFYFGSSSNLLTKLFLPPLTREELYCDSHFDKRNGRLALQLAANISGASAADIGRLCLEPAAWRAAAHIGASLLKASVSGQDSYPQGYFPYEGRTSLLVAGKWVSFGEEAQATFIVYRIQSCSHPFPFRSLQYEVKGRSRRSGNEGSALVAPRVSPFRRAARTEPDEQLTEEDPSTRLSRQARPVWGALRFPDLEAKPIWKSRTMSTSASEAACHCALVPGVQHVAIGEPGSERRVRSVDFEVQTMLNSTHPVPRFLQEAVDELKELDGVRVDLLTKSEQDGWTIPITTLANEDGEINIRFFVEIGDNQLRERRVAVFSLAQKHTLVSVVVIESDPVYLELYEQFDGELIDLGETVRCAASDFISRENSINKNWVRIVHQLFGRQDGIP